jgi:hypothetical protein
MRDPEGPQEENLAEEATQQNSNLQRLIDVFVQLIAASRDLLARLQPQSNGPPPPDAGDPKA